MNPLTTQNIESELSYAYLHAVASSASMGCKVGSRHDDNTGVDAHITAWGPFPNGGFRTEIDLKIQLKATIRTPVEKDNHFAYSLSGISQYNDLRKETVSTPRILVVLYLPNDQSEWIAHSEDALMLRKCAYWVSLRGAQASSNSTSQTVYIPKSQRFDAAGLTNLIATISRNEALLYEEPQR